MTYTPNQDTSRYQPLKPQSSPLIIDQMPSNPKQETLRLRKPSIRVPTPAPSVSSRRQPHFPPPPQNTQSRIAEPQSRALRPTLNQSPYLVTSLHMRLNNPSDLTGPTRGTFWKISQQCVLRFRPLPDRLPRVDPLTGLNRQLWPSIGALRTYTRLGPSSEWYSVGRAPS